MTTDSTFEFQNTPIYRLLGKSPVFRVEDATGRYWSKADPAGSTLKALVPGDTYWFMSEVDWTYGEETQLEVPAYKWTQAPWPFPRQPRCNTVNITPGKHLTEEGIRNVGLNLIDRIGMAPIFNLARINEIRVLDEAGFVAEGFPPEAGGGNLSVARVIMLKDNPLAFYPPEGILAATILHECVHQLTQDANLYDGSNKDEFRAYVMSQIVHWLLGEPVEVFKGTTYPTAVLTHGGILDKRAVEECINAEAARRKAVRVEGESIMLNPRYMAVGRFYLVQVKDKPYLYCKVSDNEVEVYGLA